LAPDDGGGVAVGVGDGFGGLRPAMALDPPKPNMNTKIIAGDPAANPEINSPLRFLFLTSSILHIR
jgi:hypothetical protein